MLILQVLQCILQKRKVLFTPRITYIWWEMYVFTIQDVNISTPFKKITRMSTLL